MGARVEGKKKKKSKKVNVTSKFNSTRKLSRMGKRVQKGKAGPNTEFITRSSALRKLQITLKDFRRLCILKGIYPRVPSKGLAGDDKVYYDIKDVSHIMHEPLLHKFREFKAFVKKIRRAAGRKQIDEARDQNELKPKISLDHLVKERYPRFIDGLRDLDDTLCMIHLFAALPSTGRITAEHTSVCATLCKEWAYYVAKSRCLLAIQDAAHEVPVAAAPVKTKKNKVDEKLQAKVSEAVDGMDEEEEEEEMGAALTGPLSSAFNALVPQGQEGELERSTFDASLDNATRAARLFEGLVFFLNREVPRACLQVCILSFGGLVGWQGAGSPIDMADARITHHIVDRPLQAQPGKAREYVQPQWVFDSINAQLRLPARSYAPGAQLPPHLSPFVDDEKEGYMPQYREEIRRLQGKPVAEKAQEEEAESADDDEEEEEEEAHSDEEGEGEEEGDDADSDEEEEAEELDEAPQPKRPPQDSKKGPKAIVFQVKKPKVTEEKELKDLSIQMMTKKTKRLYDRMQHGIGEKAEATKRLESKRKALESGDNVHSKTNGKAGKKARK